MSLYNDGTVPNKMNTVRLNDAYMSAIAADRTLHRGTSQTQRLSTSFDINVPQPASHPYVIPSVLNLEPTHPFNSKISALPNHILERDH